MNSSIDLDFADGTYTFALPVPQIEELQRKCAIGIGGLYGRVMQGHILVGDRIVHAPTQAQFHILDIVETIRHGLIGGGKGMVNDTEVKVSPQLANKLVQSYVMDRRLTDSWAIAAAILGACVLGYDPPKKAEPAKKPAAKTQTAD